MNCYENTFIAKQDLRENQTQELIDKYTGIIKKNSGKEHLALPKVKSSQVKRQRGSLENLFEPVTNRHSAEKFSSK